MTSTTDTMDQDEPGRNSPQSGGQRPVSTVRSYSRLRSYTGHGNLTSIYKPKVIKHDLVIEAKSKDFSIAEKRECDYLAVL